MSLPFEFAVDGVALSQRAEGKGKWSNHVMHSAAQKWRQQPSVAENVMVTITCFHRNRQFDLDNILKPILDAMKGLIYVDDEQITDLHCHKRVLSEELEARNLSSVLSEALKKSTPFVHIIVDHAPDQGVTP